ILYNKHPRRPGNFGKVVCRSTRHRCPKTSCTNPELKGNQCCPVCPPEFIALLTPSQSLSRKPLSRQNGLARLHLTLAKTSLRISIRYDGSPTQLSLFFFCNFSTDSALRPKTLVFYSPQDKKLKELNIHKKYINGSKVCLLWNDLNKQQIHLLTKQRVKVILKFKKKSGIQLSGHVTQYNGYSQDAFEAILQAKSNNNVHMAALASINLSRNGKNLHINMKYTEFSLAGNKAIIAKATFIKSSPSGKTQSLKTINVTSLQRNGGRKKITWSGPSEQHLKWLARGVVNLTLSVTAGGENVEMTGRIGIKKTCNTMYVILSGREASRPTITGASGFVSFVLKDNGQLHYRIAVAGLMQPVIEITLEMSRKRVVKKLSRSVLSDDQTRAEVVGTWERPSVAEICSLYSGSLSVNVRTGLYRRGELKGFVKQLSYGGYQNSFQSNSLYFPSEFPFLLSGNDVVPSTRTGASGLAWFSLDRHCSLHYHILLHGLDRGNQKNIITADLQGFAFAGEQPLDYEKRTNTLRSFYGKVVSGVSRDIDSAFLINLIRGRVYLQISSDDNPRGELRGQIKLEAGQCKLPQTTHYQPEGSCTSEGKTYFDGEAWYPDYDKKCTTCSCKKKKVSCFPVVCTPQNCTEALVALPDMCCPVCPVLEEQAIMLYSSRSPPKLKGCFVDEGNKFYSSTTVWHPYIEPFGYMKCVVCTCLATNNEISCSKIQCPKTACPFPVKKHPSNCCFQCPGMTSFCGGHFVWASCRYIGQERLGAIAEPIAAKHRNQ
ncbi:hypothetical protein QZH41_019347, partial [Actinostola sp. cb2023]